ncbi:histone H4 transcription factor isoform X2 [Colletes gigas]|uniref:histone H4 transcription factor isoform X2 n=1 Tax=Colletes gigas TaxID=935657 RepID=UPI001C9B3EB4|nr:histone H4 transcription factor isoform X2 [Colletes gigas]
MTEFATKLITSKDMQQRCNDWVESQKDCTYEDETHYKRKIDDEDSYRTDSEFDSVSDCPKKKRVGLPLNREILHLFCEWIDCEYESNSIDRFVKHVAQHVSDVNIQINERDIDVYECLWRDCFYTNNNPDDISRHVNYHAFHTKLKCVGSNIRSRIKLPKCHRDSGWKNVIDIPGPLLCRWEECLTHFRNYQLFIYHVVAHIEESPRGKKVKGGLECKWTGCDCMYANLYKLRDHMRHHTKEKIVACPDCGATFASNTKFHVHCKRQIPLDVQGFQCSHCNKFYATEGILRDHMRFHVFNYKCTLCDMSCESPASLAKHVRYRHVSTRPFPCQLCNHAAKSQQDLDSHMSVHTNGPNFSCHFEGCLYTCKGAYSLDRLQMVRYETEEESALPIVQTKIENKKYKIKLIPNSSVPQVKVFEDTDERVMEVEKKEAEAIIKSEGYEVKSMPVISNILISIDETDAEGNIITSRIVEAQETTELPPSEGRPLILTTN